MAAIHDQLRYQTNVPFAPYHENFSIEEHLPPGFRFDPTDDELVNIFLKKKVMNEKMPYNKIEEVNVYRHGPQLLTEMHRALGEKVWYFFTPRNQKHQNGGRPNRQTEDGSWKATSGEKKVRHHGEIVGFKQVLVFYQGKHEKAEKTNWIMHEYKVKRTADVKFDDMVLCRIYKREVDSSKVKEKEVADNRERIGPFPVTKNNNLEGRDRTEPLPLIGNNNLQGGDLTEPVPVIGDNNLQGMTNYNNNGVTNWLEDYEIKNFGLVLYTGHQNNPVFAAENTSNHENINVEGRICNNGATNSLQGYVPQFNNFGHLPYGGENNPVFAAENTFNNEIINLEGRTCNNGVPNSPQDHVLEFNNFGPLPYNGESNLVFPAENASNNENTNREGRIYDNGVTNWLEDYVVGPDPYGEVNNPVFPAESTSRSNNYNVNGSNEFNNSNLGGEDYPVFAAQVFPVEVASTSNNLNLDQENPEIQIFIEENISFEL